MPLRTTWHNSITTPVPADCTASQVIEVLHDHGVLIMLSPITTKYELISTEGEKMNYSVWEVISLGPVKREIKFNCSFESTADGVTTWIEAPMGLTSKAVYVLKPAEGGGVVLDEDVESSCNWVLKAFVESTLVSTRKQMHAQILEKAREKGVRGEAAGA